MILESFSRVKVLDYQLIRIALTDRFIKGMRSFMKWLSKKPDMIFCMNTI